MTLTSNPSPVLRAGPTMSRLLEKVVNAVPTTADWQLGPQVHWTPTGAFHRWLKYREAYSPTLLDSLSVGRDVVDPFSGSGSVMIGSALTGRRSIGIDINPFATFATRVKTTPLAADDLRELRAFANDAERDAERVEPWPLPALSIAAKGFEPAILTALLQTRRLIAERFEPGAGHEFALLAWIAIFERVGNFYKEGNGIKYRNKLRRPGKYENAVDGVWQLKRFGTDQRAHYFRQLRIQLEMMLEDAAEWESGDWMQQRVHTASALDLNSYVADGSQEAVIFSPPYANRFDYFESYKFELWFGGFVETANDMQRLRKSSMRSHLGADLRADARVHEPLEELIALMDPDTSAWRMGVPQLMRGYFDDLAQVLERSFAALNPGGQCFVVIGNSAFSGVIFPVDAFAAQLGRTVGFRDARLITTRHLTVAPQQRAALQGFEPYMRESVVVLSK